MFVFWEYIYLTYHFSSLFGLQVENAYLGLVEKPNTIETLYKVVYAYHPDDNIIVVDTLQDTDENQYEIYYTGNKVQLLDLVNLELVFSSWNNYQLNGLYRGSVRKPVIQNVLTQNSLEIQIYPVYLGVLKK